jgi:hypothetical protein
MLAGQCKEASDKDSVILNSSDAPVGECGCNNKLASSAYHTSAVVKDEHATIRNN